MSRRSARKTAFLIAFESDFHSEEKVMNILEEKLETYKEEYELNLSDINYINSILKMTEHNLLDIDHVIENHLIGWTLDRISKVCFAILRIAICEILYFEDIPNIISINEAIELTKDYHDEKEVQFVSGILAKIIA